MSSDIVMMCTYVRTCRAGIRKCYYNNYYYPYQIISHLADWIGPRHPQCNQVWLHIHPTDRDNRECKFQMHFW